MSRDAPTGDDFKPLTEHFMTPDELKNEYGTIIDYDEPFKSNGLPEDVASSRSKGNSITPPKKPHPFIQYLGYLKNVFTCLLLIAAACSFALAIAEPSFTTHIWLGIALVFVAFFNAFLLFYQEYKTAALLESFISMIPANAMIHRDGRTLNLPADQIVLGDLAHIKMGDKVPADLRLVYVSADLKVDNSSLTGESEPQERTAGALSKTTYPNPMEATNLAFNGSLVVSGEGLGIVIRTGDSTVLGQIAKATMTEKKRKAQLAEEIERFVKQLAVLCLIVLIVLVVAGFIHELEFVYILNFAVGVLVSFVPEGLPITVTALLFLAAKRMAELNVLVKDLHGVETLGSITLLATDKTGTLTQNRMTVADIWAAGVSKPTKEATTADISFLSSIYSLCALCTKCRMDDQEYEKPISERVIYGDGTEIGLYRYALEYFQKTDMKTLVSNFQRVHEVPFSSQTKFHMTFHRVTGSASSSNRAYIILLKGAPERVLARSSFILSSSKSSELFPNDATPLTEEHKKSFQNEYEAFAENGKRVIGVAYRWIQANEFDEANPPKTDDIVSTSSPLGQGFTFLALVSLIDPPKEGVKEAIVELRNAGIQIIMVTGDHPLTARAIARDIGLIKGFTKLEAASLLARPIDQVSEDDYEAIVVHGDSIEGLGEADWDNILSKKEVVFARTSPVNKLEIVTRCQAKGHIVGVSGDGVNDSPAIKKADLGIAMNKSGSDVSKEAATMILMDDRFASIVEGVKQGRLLFSNLKKSIQYTLTHIPPEVINYSVYVFFGVPLPLSPFLLLFIDLASELAPAFSYSWEPPESNLMTIPPRKVLCTPKKNYASFYEEQGLVPSGVERPRPRANSASARLDGESPMYYKTPSFYAAICGKSSLIQTSSNLRTDVLDAIMESGQLNTSRIEPKSQKQGMLSKFYGSKIAREWRKFYARNFASNETGEALVDRDMLLWAYLQGGLFITAGCFGAYLFQMYYENVPFNLLWNTADDYFNENSAPFTLTDGTVVDADQQVQLLAGAQSAYYIGIVVGQMFTLFLVKKRYGMPWGKKLFKNKVTFLALLIAAAIAGIIIYVPPFHTFIPTAPVYPIPYLMPLAAGFLLFWWDVARRVLHNRGYLGGLPTRADTIELVRRSTTEAAVSR